MYVYLRYNLLPFTIVQRPIIESTDSSNEIISNLNFVCSARDGYIIYCYGDCNRKFEEALLAQRKTGDGDDLMKAIWLDMYNEQLTRRK